MEHRNEFEPSDLIYLFLDGEADGVQQTMLFGMLAASSDMQAEFSEALQLRSAVEAERSETLPPAALTRDLFEKAGFAVAPGATAAVSPSAAIPAAILGLLRRFGVPLLCATAGALITALLFSGSYRERYGRMEEQIRRLSTERRSAADAIASMKAPWAATDRSTPTAAIPPIGGAARPGGASATAWGTPPPAIAKADRTTRAVGTPTTERTGHHASPPTEGMAEMSIGTIAAGHVIEPTPLRSVPAANRPRESGSLPAMRRTSIGSQSLPPEEMPTDEGRGFSLQLRGMTDLRFFPSLEASGQARPWFDNMSVGGLYHLSSNHALGIELGREYLPMYHASAGGAAKDDHISWVTGLYLLEADPITILGGVRPFAQGGLGTSGSGPVGRGTIGLSYAPVERVDLAIGAEGMAFFYHLDGTWYSARKAGIAYMMRVHF